jgi:hypothetical protein
MLVSAENAAVSKSLMQKLLSERTIELRRQSWATLRGLSMETIHASTYGPATTNNDTTEGSGMCSHDSFTEPIGNVFWLLCTARRDSIGTIDSLDSLIHPASFIVDDGSLGRHEDSREDKLNRIAQRINSNLQQGQSQAGGAGGTDDDIKKSQTPDKGGAGAEDLNGKHEVKKKGKKKLKSMVGMVTKFSSAFAAVQAEELAQQQEQLQSSLQQDPELEKQASDQQLMQKHLQALFGGKPKSFAGAGAGAGVGAKSRFKLNMNASSIDSTITEETQNEGLAEDDDDEEIVRSVDLDDSSLSSLDSMDSVGSSITMSPMGKSQSSTVRSKATGKSKTWKSIAKASTFAKRRSHKSKSSAATRAAATEPTEEDADDCGADDPSNQAAKPFSAIDFRTQLTGARVADAISKGSMLGTLRAYTEVGFGSSALSAIHNTSTSAAQSSNSRSAASSNYNYNSSSFNHWTGLGAHSTSSMNADADNDRIPNLEAHGMINALRSGQWRQRLQDQGNEHDDCRYSSAFNGEVL